MVRESASTMKNGKAEGPSGVASGMVKAVGEAEVDQWSSQGNTQAILISSIKS